jgi:hypothetical protein
MAGAGELAGQRPGQGGNALGNRAIFARDRARPQEPSGPRGLVPVLLCVGATMMRRHLRSAGTSSLEHVLTLAVVGLLGVAGLTVLGGAFEDAIGDGARSGVVASAPVAVGPSAMAGLVSAVREASSAAKGWAREVPARLAKAKEAYVETRRLITPTKTVPWDELKPEYAERAAKVAMKRTERRYAMIKSRFVPKTAAGTVRKLDGIDRELDHLATTLFHLDSVSDSDEISAAFNAVDEITTAFGSKLDNDEAIWAAFKRIEASRGGKRLRGEEKRAFGQAHGRAARGRRGLARRRPRASGGDRR